MTTDDIVELGLDGVVAIAERQCIDYYDDPLRTKADELRAAGNEDAAFVVDLVAVVCTFALQEDNPSNPFAPRMVMGGMRTPIVDDLEDGHFAMLESVRDAIRDAELRARIADVLWQRRGRKVADAVTAVSEYMNSARRLDDPGWWPQPFLRIKRASQVAAQIVNGMPEPMRTVDEWILERVRSLDGVDPLYYSARLMEVLLTVRRTDKERREFATQAIKTAGRASDEGDPERARAYYDVAVRWHDPVSDAETIRALRIAAAETILARARSQAQAIAKASLLADAVVALRNAGADAAQVDAIRRELDESQRASLSGMKTLSAEVDITDMVKAARKAAEGLQFEHAIVKITRMVRIPTVSDLRAEVEGSIKNTPLRMSLSSRQIDRFGRVTGVRSGVFGDDADREGAILSEMHECSRRRRAIAVDAVIEPYRKQMMSEHRPSLADFMRLVHDRPLVPPQGRAFFVRGLYAGYYGDFIEATHLLVPALEHALRMLLASTGALVYSQSPLGIQDFFDLNRILDEPGTLAALHEDYIFELKGLLVSRFGENLRNNVAHGLLTPNETQGPAAVFLWWLTLDLIFSLNYVGNERVDASGSTLE